MRALGLVLLALLLLCPALASDEQGIKDCQYWRLGKDEPEQNRRAAVCDRIIDAKGSTSEERASAYAIRADRASSQERRADAIADFDKALVLDPDHVEWVHDRAFLLHFDNQHDRAIN